MDTCEQCGQNDWSIIDRNWKRCEVCGRPETRIQKRHCINCGKPIGKYAKPSLITCIKCQGIQVPFESLIPCQTIACGNTLGTRASPSGYCRQCLREINDWDTPNGHTWKQKALSYLKETKRRYILFGLMKKSYPEITENTLFNWITRQTNAGVLERIAIGAYRALENGVPESPTDSPTSIRIDPNDYSNPKMIQILGFREPDD